MILTHMIDIDETLKLTQSQGHILQQSTFGSMKMCICVKQARLTYLRGVNVLVFNVDSLFKVDFPETCFRESEFFGLMVCMISQSVFIQITSNFVHIIFMDLSMEPTKI